MMEARIVAALVNATWQSALVTIVATIALRLHGRTSARVRCAIWCAVLSIVAALPAIDFAQTRTVLDAPAVAARALQRSVPAASGVVRVAPVRAQRDLPAAPPATVTVATRPRIDPAASVHRAGVFLEAAGRPMFWLWLAAATLLGLRLTFGLSSLALMRRRFTTLHGDWLERNPRLPTLPVCASDAVAVPCLVGLVRPTIVIPRPLVDELTDDDLRRIVLHEAAHAQRYDHWINLFVQFARTLLFFNPIVHLVAARIGVEREIACDDRVVELSGDRVVYAACLSTLARTVSLSHAHAVPGFFNGRAQIVVRIEQLLDRAHDGTSRLGRRSAFALIALAAIAAVLVQFGVPLVAVASRERVRTERMAQTHVAPRVATAVRVRTEPRAQVAPPVARQRVAVEPARAVPPKRAPAVPAAAVKVAPAPLKVAAPAVVAAPAAPAALAPARVVAVVQSAGDSANASESGSGSFIDELAAAGYHGLSVDQLIALREHGVSGRFLAAIKAAGYGSVSVAELIQMRDHGVRPEDIASLNAMSHQHLSVDELIALRDHGVSASYANELAAAGVSVPFDQLLTLRDHGVSASFIAEMHGLGYPHLDAGRLVDLRDHGVSGKFVQDMRQAGYANLSVDELIQLRDHGVNGTFVERVRHEMTRLPSVDDLIRLRDAGE